MPSINFDFDASELIQAMEKATKQYPASAEKVLKKEAKNIAKDFTRTSKFRSKRAPLCRAGEQHLNLWQKASDRESNAIRK
ncbi:MAG: hypothetical protein ACLRH0_07045 [Blautia wexlerae]